MKIIQTKLEGVVLSGDNHRQLIIPEGFAHGFCVLSEYAIFSYKCSDIYTPEAEGGIAWNRLSVPQAPCVHQMKLLFNSLSVALVI